MAKHSLRGSLVERYELPAAIGFSGLCTPTLYSFISCVPHSISLFSCELAAADPHSITNLLLHVNIYHLI